MEKGFLPNHQDILDCLREHYGIYLTALTPLSIGADSSASVYRGLDENRSTYFIKLKRGYEDNSSAILEFLSKAGMRQLIPPIRTLMDRAQQPLRGYTLTVYPFIEGADGFTQSLTHAQWITLGRALRQLHDLDVPWALLPRNRTERFSPEHRDAVRQLLLQLDSVEAPDSVAERLVESLQTHRMTIQRLVDRAEQLAQKARIRSHSYVLCHADIHGGNVLLDREERLYIVDWDDSVLAPRERDLMFIGGGIANVWNDPVEEQAFYQGYGDIAIDRSLLAYYRHERIVVDVVEFCRDLSTESVGLKDRDIRYRQFLDMFTPKGVVEIAFRTDTGREVP